MWITTHLYSNYDGYESVLFWLLRKTTEITLVVQNDALLHGSAFSLPSFITSSKHIVYSGLVHRAYHLEA